MWFRHVAGSQRYCPTRLVSLFGIMYTPTYFNLGRVALTHSVTIRFLALIAMTYLCGCAARVPHVRAWQPWTRVVDTPTSLEKGAVIAIYMDGKTAPLPDGDELLHKELERRTEALLSRRGYSTSDREFDYELRMIYKTERNDMLSVMSSVKTVNYALMATGTGSGSATSSGLGVSLARSIAALALASANMAEQSVTESVSYTHSISIAISDKLGEEIWKGESTWDSPQLDILAEISSVLQLLFSGLPIDSSVRPEVSEAKGSHAANYFKLYCIQRWFTCPALPYRIAFSAERYALVNGIPKTIKNPEALPAYLDLIQTAEYALPHGSKDREDPLRNDLWSKAMLGRQYLLGPEQRPVNVLVKLTGHSQGYLVEKCWLATDDEYAAFEGELMDWRQLLEEYYDVFVR